MPRKSKAYKEGMAAGAAPFEEKFNKQAEAVEKISKNINSKLDGLNGIMDVVLDEMSAQERKKIYDLNTIVDISKLDNAEKGFLCSAVFAVANQNETNVTENNVNSSENTNQNFRTRNYY